MQIVSVTGNQISANAVGVIDPNDPTRYLETGSPVGLGPFSFSRSDVTGLWRNKKRLW
jgi:hypothetical protein